jgi:hypothetical protein
MKIQSNSTSRAGPVIAACAAIIALFWFFSGGSNRPSATETSAASAPGLASHGKRGTEVPETDESKASLAPSTGPLPPAPQDPKSDPAYVRESGYVFGNIIRDAHSTETKNSDGAKRLDLTNAASAAARSQQPVNLGDVNASPDLRAEFYAATLTGALNISAKQQAPVAAALRESYAADYSAREATQDALSELRRNLSEQAHARFRSMLNASEQARFNEMFSPEDFLFSISITSDEITISGPSPK